MILTNEFASARMPPALSASIIILFLCLCGLEGMIGTQHIQPDGENVLGTSLKENPDADPVPPDEKTNYAYDKARSGNDENKSVGAWTIFWDPDSHDNLTENPDIFNHVYPYWYVIDELGNIVSTSSDSFEFKNKTETYHALGIEVIPILYSGDYETYTYLINKTDLRTEHIHEIRDLAINMSFDGIEINYEALPYEHRFTFVSFIENLTEEMHRYNKTVYVTLYPRSTGDLSGLACDSYLYEPLGKAADFAKIMAYNEHWATHPVAGPVASYPWVEDVVKYAIQTIELEKIILGIPTYGYDWAVDPGGKTLEIARNYSYRDAERMRNLIDAKRQWNESGRCPYYEYFDSLVSNQLRQVHYSDNQSFAYLLYLVQKYDLHGLSLWYLGGHDGKVNSIMRKWISSGFSNIQPLAYCGEGRFAQVGSRIYFNSSLALDIDGVIERIHWDFGDGNTSEIINSCHIFERPGKYIVSLLVEDSEGCLDRDFTTIVIGPYANPGPDRVTDEDAVISFNGLDSIDRDGIISYTWDFGDGHISFHSGPIVSHIYETPGNYTVGLTIINRTGYVTLGKCKVWVRDITKPDAHVTENIVVRKGQIASLDASESTDNGVIVRYGWDFGDGNRTTTSNSWVNHVYRKMGNYNVSVTVFDSDWNWNFASAVVIVLDGDPPSVRVNYSDEVPLGTTAVFNASGSTDNIKVTSFNWTFGDGTFLNNTIDPIAKHLYSDPGRYFITLLITDAVGNWNTTTFHIDVRDVNYPEPIINISLMEKGNVSEQSEYRLIHGNNTDPTDHPGNANNTKMPVFRAEVNRTIIFNGSKSTDDFRIVNYTWELGDGSIFYDKSFYFAYQETGEYTVVLRISDIGGNVAELTVPVEIIEPTEENGTGNENDTKDEEAPDINRKKMNENLVKLFWILFAVVMVIIIVYDVTVNMKGLHVEKEMDESFDPTLPHKVLPINKNKIERPHIEGEFGEIKKIS